jgi:hypothetical protein
VSADIFVYTGSDATGAITEVIADLSAGGSQKVLYNPASGVSADIFNYTRSNATGTLTASIADFSSGGSLEEEYNPASGVSVDILNYTGSDATGAVTESITDFLSGWSQKVVYNPSSGVSADIFDYTGISATGAITEVIADLSAGGSQEVVYNPASGVSAEVFNYTGSNGAGALVAETSDYTNGTSELRQFTGLSGFSGPVTEEDYYYSQIDDGGHITNETIDESDGITVRITDTYNMSGTLIEKYEVGYLNGAEGGFTDYNLQANTITADVTGGQFNLLDPGYLFDPSNPSGNSFNPASNPNSAIVDSSAFSWVVGCGGTTLDSDGDYDNDPLLISMDHGPINLLPAGHVSFDFSGSDEATPTGWMGADTGMLVLDTNGKGILGKGTSVIQGFGALSALDSGGNGVIDKNNPLYSEIKVWGDANSNGHIDTGELHSLAALGIQSISLQSRPTDEVIAGNIITAKGTATLTGGAIEAIDDVTFASAPLALGAGVVTASHFLASDPHGALGFQIQNTHLLQT